MNREILFRGKRADDGEWVYGNLFYDPDLEQTQILYFEYDLTYYGEDRESKGGIVDSCTVGQYTGLTDKNGRKIFEGDIVRRSNRNGQKTISYVVEWCSDCCMFVLDCIDFDMEFDMDFTVYYGNEFEIIGNIHDNPELVRKDEENGSSYKSD